jgi:hypothetical protein
MTTKKYIRLCSYEGRNDTAYLELQDHPHELVPGIVARTLNIHELVDNYDGPRLTLEFDNENRPIGIEIIYPTQCQDDEDE